MSEIKKASAGFGSLNCAECLIKAYNEEFEKEVPVSLGSGMGSGLVSGSVCGAVLAASMLLGFEKGRNTVAETNDARGLVKDFIKAVREKYGSELCKEIKGSGRGCSDIIDFAYEEMKARLKE